MGYSIVLPVYSTSNDDQIKGLLTTKEYNTNHTECGRTEPPMFWMIPSQLIGPKKLQETLDASTLDADSRTNFLTGVAELHTLDKSYTNDLRKAFVCVPMDVLEKSSTLNTTLVIPCVSNSKILKTTKRGFIVYITIKP